MLVPGGYAASAGAVEKNSAMVPSKPVSKARFIGCPCEVSDAPRPRYPVFSLVARPRSSCLMPFGHRRVH